MRVSSSGAETFPCPSYLLVALDAVLVATSVVVCGGPATSTRRDSYHARWFLTFPEIPMWLRIQVMAVSWFLPLYTACFRCLSIPDLRGWPLLRLTAVCRAAWELAEFLQQPPDTRNLHALIVLL